MQGLWFNLISMHLFTFTSGDFWFIMCGCIGDWIWGQDVPADREVHRHTPTTKKKLVDGGLYSTQL